MNWEGRFRYSHLNVLLLEFLHGGDCFKGFYLDYLRQDCWWSDKSWLLQQKTLSFLGRLGSLALLLAALEALGAEEVRVVVAVECLAVGAEDGGIGVVLGFHDVESYDC